MKFGKYIFKSFQEFQQVLSLATKNGAGAGEKLENFLRQHYSHKMVKSK